MNRSTSTYCQTNFNTTTAGAITSLVFTDEEKASGFLDSKAQRKCLFSGFVFTGKERDEETGYGYFGARYMDHELTTMWLSVDPMADKYPSISPYAYCAWNPIVIIDPDGRDSVYYSLYGDEVHRVKCEEQVKLLAICNGKKGFNKDFSINVAHIDLGKMNELYDYSDNYHKECGYQVKRDGTKENTVYGTKKNQDFRNS